MKPIEKERNDFLKFYSNPKGLSKLSISTQCYVLAAQGRFLDWFDRHYKGEKIPDWENKKAKEDYEFLVGIMNEVRSGKK